MYVAITLTDDQGSMLKSSLILSSRSCVGPRTHERTTKDLRKEEFEGPQILLKRCLRIGIVRVER